MTVNDSLRFSYIRSGPDDAWGGGYGFVPCANFFFRF